jgi:membrane protease subunit HflK
MPWSNQNGGGGGPWGGGGNGGGNNQGPWGKGPQPPRGGGNPPDLEELIRRGQDKLRQAFPGGGGSGSGSSKLIVGLVASGSGRPLAYAVCLHGPAR